MERRKNGIDTVVGERYIGNIAFSFDDTAYTKNSWKNSAIFSHVRAVLRSLCGPFFSGAVAALKILL